MTRSARLRRLARRGTEDQQYAQQLREVEGEIFGRRGEGHVHPTNERMQALRRPARRPAARLPLDPPDRHQRQDHARPG